ncbi:DUF6368 family protein [Microbispora sp. NPDC049125]|uniref:DUF6368 family protein n=1 Tax=Microbispora sp. NPDC049125 TaxID=3154929 RepID=UPI003467B344
MRPLTRSTGGNEGMFMAGPAVALLLTKRRERSDFTDLVPWLETFCDPVEIDDDDSLNFWIRKPATLGAPPDLDVTEAGLFNLSHDNNFGMGGEDYSAFTPPPVQGLALFAGSSGRTNHLLLGYVALVMARRFSAFIDFDGALGYRRRLLDLVTENETRRTEARQLVSSLPGVIKEVSWSYPDDYGSHGWSHVGDAEFLAAWLEHPEFHLIK